MSILVRVVFTVVVVDKSVKMVRVVTKGPVSLYVPKRHFFVMVDVSRRVRASVIVVVVARPVV